MKISKIYLTQSTISGTIVEINEYGKMLSERKFLTRKLIDGACAD